MALVTAAVLVALVPGFSPTGGPHAISHASRAAIFCTNTASTTQAASPRSEGLALMLDDGTRKSHSVAENTAFVTGFFRGIASPESFAQLVASLYFVYEAMEACFDACEDPRVCALDFPELRRRAALERDMAFFHGPNWPESVRPTPATRAYVEHIRRVARDRPELLVAHQYTRYLGDLFGGQMMGGMAQRTLGLQGGQGTAFYQFEGIPDTKAFIDAWYARLNAQPFDPAARAAIVDEGNRVFTYNIALFEELEGAWWRAAWALAVRGLADWDARVNAQWGLRV